MMHILSSRPVYEDRWMKLEMEKVRTENGQEFDYLLSHPREFVIIVPMLSPEEVIMIRHYKHGIRREIIGFPAGYVEDGESPAEAAARELEEETGRSAADIQHVASLSQNPSRCRTAFHIFIAEGLSERAANAANADSQEGDIATETVGIQKLLDPEFCNLVGDGYMLAAVPFILARM